MTTPPQKQQQQQRFGVLPVVGEVAQHGGIAPVAGTFCNSLGHWSDAKNALLRAIDVASGAAAASRPGPAAASIAGHSRSIFL